MKTKFSIILILCLMFTSIIQINSNAKTANEDSFKKGDEEDLPFDDDPEEFNEMVDNLQDAMELINESEEDNPFDVPDEFKEMLVNLQSTVDVIENYASFILAYEDLNLPELDEALTESSAYSELSKNLPEHQRQARNNARVWLYNVYPHLFQTIRSIVDYIEVFEDSTDTLFELLPHIAKDEEKKEEFVAILEELLKDIEERRVYSGEVADSLYDLGVTRLTKDKQNFERDVLLTNVLIDTSNDPDVPGTSAWFEERIERLEQGIRDKERERDNCPWYTFGICKRNKTNDINRIKYNLELEKARFDFFTEGIQNVRKIESEFNELIDTFDGINREVEQNLRTGWLTLESRLRERVLKPLENIDPNSPLWIKIKIDLEVALSGWSDTKPLAESLLVNEEPRDDRPDPPRPPESIGLFQVTTSEIGIEWADSDVAEEIDTWEIYRDGQKIGEIDTKETEELKYKDKDLLRDTKYTYYVVARNVLGDRSEEGKEFSFSTRSLNAPSNLRETSTTPTTVDIEWNPSPTFEGMTIEYEVYDLTQDSGIEPVGRTKDTKLTVSDLDPDTEYTFGIVARDDRQHSPVFSEDPQNRSNMSDLLSVTTPIGLNSTMIKDAYAEVLDPFINGESTEKATKDLVTEKSRELAAIIRSLDESNEEVELSANASLLYGRMINSSIDEFVKGDRSVEWLREYVANQAEIIGRMVDSLEEEDVSIIDLFLGE